MGTRGPVLEGFVIELFEEALPAPPVCVVEGWAPRPAVVVPLDTPAELLPAAPPPPEAPPDPPDWASRVEVESPTIKRPVRKARP